MGTYRIMMITAQARQVHSRRATQGEELRGVIHQPLSVLGQLAVGALLSLSLAATYVAKVLLNSGGAINPLMVGLALAALLTAGLVAGGAWRAPGKHGRSDHERRARGDTACSAAAAPDWGGRFHLAARLPGRPGPAAGEPVLLHSTT